MPLPLSPPPATVVMVPPSRAVAGGKAGGLDGGHAEIDAAEGITVGEPVGRWLVVATPPVFPQLVNTASPATMTKIIERRGACPMPTGTLPARYGLRRRLQPYQPTTSAITSVLPAALKMSSLPLGPTRTTTRLGIVWPAVKFKSEVVGWAAPSGKSVR